MRSADETNGSTEVLSQCIQAIEAKKMTIQGCVARYPGVPDLEGLLHTMMATRRLSRPAFAPAEKSAMRQALLNRYREQQASKSRRQAAPRRRTNAWLRFAAVLGAVIVIVLMSGAGLVRAASDAVPGDGLYGLKRLVEQVELSNADDRTRPETLYRIAMTRIAEVDVLADRQHPLTDSELSDLSQSIKAALGTQPDATRRTTLIFSADTALAKAETAGVLTVLRHTEMLQTLSDISTQTVPDGATPAPTITPTLTPTATRTPTDVPEPPEIVVVTPEDSATDDMPSLLTLTPEPTDKAHPTHKPTKIGQGNGNPNGGQGNGNDNGKGNGNDNGKGNDK